MVLHLSLVFVSSSPIGYCYASTLELQAVIYPAPKRTKSAIRSALLLRARGRHDHTEKEGNSTMSALPLAIPRDFLKEFCERNHIRKLSVFGSVLTCAAQDTPKAAWP
jgi:hypothetical protein